MSSDLIIACVSVGNYAGRGDEYVRKLEAGVRRHLPVPFQFVCVTDAESPPCDFVPAVPGLTGWWQKMALFKPGLLPRGRVLSFDLDTVIVDDISHLAEPRPWSMLTDFILGTPSSAIMAWPDGFGADIWAEYERQGCPQRFIKDQWGTAGGDQDWLARYAPAPLRLQDSVDGLLASWIHCQQGLPDGARAVSFWGKKRPHQCNGWVEREWRV